MTVVPAFHPHRSCKVCRLPSSVSGYSDFLELMGGHLANGGSIAALHREIAQRYFHEWPESSRFSYDSLHSHCGRHLNLDSLPLRGAVMRETQENAALIQAIGQAYSEANRDIDLLVAFARARLEDSDLDMTISHAIRIVELKVHMDDAVLKREVALLRTALDMLVDVVGPFLGERATDHVLKKLHRQEDSGSAAAGLLLDSVRSWNRLPITWDEPTDARKAG